VQIACVEQMSVRAAHSSMSRQTPIASPLYPGEHEPHEKEPNEFVQEAPATQWAVPVAHSSMSLQVSPSPEKPLLHVQT
jgi:hypothetical protein